MDWREVLLVVIFVIAIIAYLAIMLWVGCNLNNSVYYVTHQAQNPPRAQIYGGEI